jgi:hypothetical protein
MPHTNYEPSATLFGQKMQEHMDTLHLEIRDVADQVGSTYEYMRKLVRGLSLPSKYMVGTLSGVLQWDKEEMMRLMAADRIRKEHGDIPLELSGKNPKVEPFERGWDRLTEQQQEILLGQLNTFLKQNRKHKVGAPA